MKTVKLKTIGSGYGFSSLQNPEVIPGLNVTTDTITYVVVSVPDDTPEQEVVQRFNNSVTLSGFTFDFNNLGDGRIVRGL